MPCHGSHAWPRNLAAPPPLTQRRVCQGAERQQSCAEREVRRHVGGQGCLGWQLLPVAAACKGACVAAAFNACAICGGHGFRAGSSSTRGNPPSPAPHFAAQHDCLWRARGMEGSGCDPATSFPATATTATARWPWHAWALAWWAQVGGECLLDLCRVVHLHHMQRPAHHVIIYPSFLVPAASVWRWLGGGGTLAPPEPHYVALTHPTAVDGWPAGFPPRDPKCQAQAAERGNVLWRKKAVHWRRIELRSGPWQGPMLPLYH